MDSRETRIKLGENEKLIRCYRIDSSGRGGLFSPKNTVDLSVTTKRLIHTVTDSCVSQKSVRYTQCNIEDVCDMRYGQSNRIRISLMILGGLWALLGLILLLTSFTGGGGVNVPLLVLGIIFTGVGVLCIVLGVSKKTRVWFYITAKTGDDFLTCGKGGRMKAMKIGKTSKEISRDFFRMLDELPAIIVDILDIGEAAARKWGEE